MGTRLGGAAVGTITIHVGPGGRAEAVYFRPGRRRTRAICEALGVDPARVERVGDWGVVRVADPGRLRHGTFARAGVVLVGGGQAGGETYAFERADGTTDGRVTRDIDEAHAHAVANGLALVATTADGGRLLVEDYRPEDPGPCPACGCSPDDPDSDGCRSCGGGR